MSEPVRPSLPAQRIRGDASKRLRRSAIRAVRNNSDAIAEALLKQTLKGTTACGKLLIPHPGSRTGKVSQAAQTRAATPAGAQTRPAQTQTQPRHRMGQ